MSLRTKFPCQKPSRPLMQKASLSALKPLRNCKRKSSSFSVQFLRVLRMPLLPKDPNGCPYLQLAPMEGVGDRSFRKAMASIGGFDEAVRDFLRVPRQAHIESLAREYTPHEI